MRPCIIGVRHCGGGGHLCRSEEREWTLLKASAADCRAWVLREEFALFSQPGKRSARGDVEGRSPLSVEQEMPQAV